MRGNSDADPQRSRASTGSAAVEAKSVSFEELFNQAVMPCCALNLT